MIALHALAAVLRKFLDLVLVLSLAALGLSVLTQIVLREVFGYAYLPLDDIIPYSFSLSTFAGMALLFGEGGHISITIFSDIMPEAARRAVLWFAELAAVLFLAFLAWIGWEFMLDGGYQYSPLLNIRLCYVYAAVPFCAFSALVFMAEKRLGGASENHH